MMRWVSSTPRGLLGWLRLDIKAVFIGIKAQTPVHSRNTAGAAWNTTSLNCSNSGAIR